MPSVLAVMLLFGSAEAGKLVIAQGGDGTLYVVTDKGRYTLVPVGISDEELNASVDLGTVGGDQLVQPVQQQPVTIEGEGGFNSAPFSLPAGNYLVTWTAKPQASSRVNQCFYGASLKPVTPAAPGSGFISASLGNAQVDGTKTGETRIYNVPAGDYYVTASSSCRWSVTLTPV